jgi:hypothetical protein
MGRVNNMKLKLGLTRMAAVLGRRENYCLDRQISLDMARRLYILLLQIFFYYNNFS